MTATLPKRALGPFSVSAIGLGCMNLSHGYQPRPEAEAAERLLLHALDRGVTFFDTAALYGFGANETLIGRALGHRRKDFVLASKCALGEINGKRGLDGSAAAITQTLDEALIRLRTDVIDLYYLHRLDPKVPMEESVGALSRAVEAGKIRTIGLSEVSAETIRAVHAIHPVTAVQTEYSPWTRNVELAVLDCCEELGIGFIAFSPLARGLLAGSVGTAGFQQGDLRAAMPRFQEPHLTRNLGLYDQMAGLARAADCTPAQLCLAWLLSKRDFVVPIPGTTNIDHLDEILDTLSLTISEVVFDQVDALFAFGAVSGPRYSKEAQSQIGTEIWEGEPLAS
ncbi:MULTISPECIES: aldo/keto reductase [Sphingomonadales]|jgi:aryl-alcohol dehydrogenase-like predicted oxidoreductase|uniref:Aldo/keto reductase n=5 Tax=Sphingomonadaceae TaxID=41297 RepID=A0A249MZ98_SPHXE|nr:MULTISPECIES: aldo/keto reductase [Sphingomonadales]MAC58215.1 aldo/keto reductase [Novosphingobium sp.]MBJ7440949.1 aldo/keto reductase [Sphingopyxis sp.]ASY46703.1 aldo/keto reductase [Sphingobium xenophagum]MBB6125505.1 hypothetical protein [Sphingobium subterraneum]MBP8233715.1 aldo/keto reductase [Rhizorhabdus sp.]|tara:strand:+ start:14440 stop:15456 length:1017 start_codon:yes stop_codon:yes gene_type:complete